MMAEALLNAYIDANILLVVAFVFWRLTRMVMRQTGAGAAFRAQLRLLNISLIAIALSPLAIAVSSHVMPSGWIAQTPTVSDLVVTQYLSGAFHMKPSEFSSILSLRSDLVAYVLGGSILSAALLIGAIISLAALLRSALRIRLILRSCFAWRRFGSVHLMLSDRISGPFSTRSLRRRYVVIPTGMLTNSDDLRLVIAHELEHIRQGDLEWEIGLEVLRPLFFWNPAFAACKTHVDALRELACDQTLLHRRGFDVQKYGTCLLNVCQAGLARPERQMAFARVAFLKTDHISLLRQRIMSLPQTGPGDCPVAIPAFLTVALLSLCAISLKPAQGWSHERLMLSTILNLERLEAVNTLNQRTW